MEKTDISRNVYLTIRDGKPDEVFTNETVVQTICSAYGNEGLTYIAIPVDLGIDVDNRRMEWKN